MIIEDYPVVLVFNIMIVFHAVCFSKKIRNELQVYSRGLSLHPNGGFG